MSYLYEHPPAPNRIINYEPNNEQIWDFRWQLMCKT
jgi:hypothetical protein